jgi:predicted nucleic acid binding AN1-type Zn finger protein
LMDIQCRCEHYFCSLHRYAEAHKCTFDYKALNKAQLEKNNPLVTGTKLLDRI